MKDVARAGTAKSVGDAVEMARNVENRADLHAQTAWYFRGLPAGVAAEESDLEDALSLASQELDFDQP
jgi:hypothetical protein